MRKTKLLNGIWALAPITLLMLSPGLALGDIINGIDPNSNADEFNAPPGILEVSAIRSHTVLVRSSKTIMSCGDGDCIERRSDLQVSIMVYENGPSTDVSPPATLYFTMYNSVEETGIARSVHLIADVEKLIKAKRVAAGIYEITYKGFWSQDNCFQPNFRARIDARALSIKVRAAKEVQFLDDRTYVDPIEVDYKRLNCPLEN